MRIALTGSSGLVGRALRASLAPDGHEITRVVRSPRAAQAGDAVFWSPASGQIDAAGLEAHDAVIHLAGESLFGYWTEARKRRIRDSRIQGTRLLARTLAGLRQRPRVMLSASGVNYYGDRPDEVVDEDSPPGTGFLARVSVEWERAADPAAEAGIRVVRMRSAVVLSTNGGALHLMLPIFRLGLGGRIGSGEQPFPWVDIDDAVGAVRHLLDHDDIAGAVNVCAPETPTLGRFVRTLADVLHRPAFMAVPALAARLVAGELANELLLAGARVRPKRLLESGYAFRHPDLEGALHALLD